MKRAPCRRRTGEAVPRAETFGYLRTADHKVLNEEGESRNNHRHANVVQNLATQWIQSDPCKTKTFQGTDESLRKFLEPSEKPNVTYLANPVKTYHGIIELRHLSDPRPIVLLKAVRRIKEGTSAALLQQVLDEKWWAGCMKCYCYLRRVQDLADGTTPYE